MNGWCHGLADLVLAHRQPPERAPQPRLPDARRVRLRRDVLGRLQHRAGGHQHRDVLHRLATRCGTMSIEELQRTVHFSNRSGVRAICPDCHVPHDWTDKIARKMQASKEVWGKIFGTIDTAEIPRQAPGARRARMGAAEGQRRWNAATAIPRRDGPDQADPARGGHSPQFLIRRADLHRLPQGHRA